MHAGLDVPLCWSASERWKKKKQASSVVSEEHGMHINDLQTDVLQRIFSLLDQTERQESSQHLLAGKIVQDMRRE